MLTLSSLSFFALVKIAVFDHYGASRSNPLKGMDY